MKFIIMDRSGHSTLNFAHNSEGLSQAKAKFDQLLKMHHTVAFRNAGQTDYHVSRKFDPTADEALFIRPMFGG